MPLKAMARLVAAYLWAASLSHVTQEGMSVAAAAAVVYEIRGGCAYDETYQKLVRAKLSEFD